MKAKPTTAKILNIKSLILSLLIIQLPKLTLIVISRVCALAKVLEHETDIPQVSGSFVRNLSVLVWFLTKQLPSVFQCQKGLSIHLQACRRVTTK